MDEIYGQPNIILFLDYIVTYNKLSQFVTTLLNHYIVMWHTFRISKNNNNKSSMWVPMTYHMGPRLALDVGHMAPKVNLSHMAPRAALGHMAPMLDLGHNENPYIG
jgi:high-affinity nickel permease